jgi:ligand-binding SRPBCC domain-containing protein
LHLKLEFKVKQSPDLVFAQFNEKLFLALAPPFPPSQLTRFDGCKTGDAVALHIGIKPFQSAWVSYISNHGQSDTEIWFQDEGKVLPFFLKTWSHRHIISQTKLGSTITEDIHFTTPTLLPAWILFPLLYLTFAYRGPVYRRWFGKI